MKALKVDNVVKKYKDVVAVNNLNFTLEKGEILGFLGPNGAGKSSTMRMIMNITMPDSGKVEVFGESFKDEFRDRIGYLPEERGLYQNMKVLEHLIFLGQMKGMTKNAAKESSLKWLEKVGMLDRKDSRVSELSKGMAQKIQFVGTILHDPELIIMDEPFSGLDPVNTKFLKDILIGMKNNGKSIILSTHLMENAEKLCSSIFLINKGKQVLFGDLAAIRREYSVNSVIVSFEGDASIIENLDLVESVNSYSNHCEVTLRDGFTSKDLFRRLADENLTIDYFKATDASLNDIFLKVVENNG